MSIKNKPLELPDSEVELDRGMAPESWSFFSMFGLRRRGSAYSAGRKSLSSMGSRKSSVLSFSLDLVRALFGQRWGATSHERALSLARVFPIQAAVQVCGSRTFCSRERPNSRSQLALDWGTQLTSFPSAPPLPGLAT